MTTSNEKIIKDKSKRILGDKIYLDDYWVGDSVTQEANFSTSSDSQQDVTNMSITKYFGRATSVLILFSIYFEIMGLSYAIGNLDVDGDTQHPELYGATLESFIARSGHIVVDLDEGSHVFKLQLRSSDNGQTVKTVVGSSLILVELHK